MFNFFIFYIKHNKLSMPSSKTISIFKSKKIDDDICAICHENLNSEQTFEIPECNHIFHSNCLLQWFRTGELRCPYCNSSCSSNEHSHWREKKIKYKIISNYCRRKDADKEIVKKVNQIRELDNKSKNIANEIKDIKSQTGEYKVLKKKITNLSNKRWTIKRKVREKKQELLYSVNILPFFIGKK